jgi:ribosomal protein L11 methyltransferase
VRELTLRVAGGNLEEVLDELLPALPGGVHIREGDGEAELAILTVPETPDEEALRRLAGDALLELTAAEVSDDWRERRLARYEPLVVADRFLLRPEWAPPSDDSQLIEIVLEQHRAFGSGVHPTTQACLAALAELEPGGSLVDLGCGSGVLAIAAAKLGWSPVIAVDVAEESVAATAANAARNGVEVEARRLDLTAEQPPRADTVVVNVPPSVQIPLIERLAHSPPTVIASGFKPAEEDSVAATWERRGLRVAERARTNDWSLLRLRASGEEA